MTTSHHLLQDLDTAVTLTWEDTRSMGTLLEFGGRRLLLTSLRAPTVGITAFLRIEREDHSEAIAVDGKVVNVSESEWGEQQVEMEIERVGTTGTPAALKAFLERHYIEAGGTVVAGRSRDNPEQKRYVYTLPLRAAGAAVTEAVVSPAAAAPEAAPAATSNAAVTTTTPLVAAAVAMPLLDTSSLVGANPYAPLAPAERPQTVDLGDADELMAALDAAARGLSPQQPAIPAHLSTARATFGHDTEATHHVSPLVRSQIDPEHDESEEILVETVPASSQQAMVVSPSGPALSTRTAAKPIAATPGAATRPTPAAMPALSSSPSTAPLYASDRTARVELAVQFEAGAKKRKYAGVVVRLGEGKLRIRSNSLPERYERIVVLLPGKQGAKDAAPLKCEVTRVQGESGVGEASFDAKVAGANAPPVMARLRQLLQDLAGQPAENPTP